MEPQSYTIMGNHRFETYGVGSNSVTSAHVPKECLFKKNQKKVSYFIKCTSFNDVLRSVFIYFLP